MFTIAKVLLTIAVATCVSHPIYALEEERQQGLSATDLLLDASYSLALANGTDFEDYIQAKLLVGHLKSGGLRETPASMLNILRNNQCGLVYKTSGEGSITATFLGAGDSNKENMGGGADATTEILSDRNWWAIEFDVSADVCIKELYIGCSSNAHKSGSKRYQMWTASKINKEGVDKSGKSWWRGDDCYHIGWFKVREDFMDWA